MPDYMLGTVEASEALIKDLYIDLRAKVNRWSKITCQTPQARMGYVGQHLVSVVTGYPGGKSGARGYDLIMGESFYGEIKTCYKVDQLGACNRCGAVVSSLETACAACGSTDINRKDDSKWLISLRNDDEFEKVIEPTRYYFVLFELEEPKSPVNHNIVASIWEVNPKEKGFAFCMVDYYLNIRATSKSHAPFNMWPHEFKFALTKPTLIYRSIIDSDDTIHTIVFPSLGNCVKDPLKNLADYARATTITETAVKNIIRRFSPGEDVGRLSKPDCLNALERIRHEKRIDNDVLCDAFADEVYLPLILPHKNRIPESIKRHFSELD
ncbi:MAG: MamI family restriction endonuclease [Oscillospiraceae bacterium]|nr:MamI family restriction endonuclease [Oscillospiraceae bacterium]